MSQHVKPGSIAKAARRKSAAERLEKHMSNHKLGHGMVGVTDEELVKNFTSHDTRQKDELKKLQAKVSS